MNWSKNPYDENPFDQSQGAYNERAVDPRQPLTRTTNPSPPEWLQDKSKSDPNFGGSAKLSGDSQPIEVAPITPGEVDP